MENTTSIQRYTDSPLPSRSTTPTPPNAPSSKPHHDPQPPAYTDEGPYRDDPSSPHASPRRTHHITLPAPYTPYTDTSTPPTPNDDDVPLAHLLHTAPPHHLSAQAFYPLDAPPSYSVAVRQAYHQTLIQHVPPQRLRIPRSRDDVEARLGLVLGFETEGSVDGERPDDVRHDVEKVVAMFVVAILLLIVSAVLGWLALGSGVFA